MSSITTSKTIEKLRIIFANHGIPQKLVSDNGPTFTSAEFRTFMARNGIRHITSAPYHPSTNGLTERAVQTFKQALQRISGCSVQERLSKFLFKYRVTPHTVTGIPPCEMLMGRRLRSRLDLLYPSIATRVESHQEKQKESHDTKRPLRTFQVGDLVYAEKFSGLPKWIPASIVKVTGPLSYELELSDSKEIKWRRHVDSIRGREQHNSE